jgi:hypothetical protein
MNKINLKFHNLADAMSIVLNIVFNPTLVSGCGEIGISAGLHTHTGGRPVHTCAQYGWERHPHPHGWCFVLVSSLPFPFPF